MNYEKEYNSWWSKPENKGRTFVPDSRRLAREILLTCGWGRFLDAGCGEGLLVSSLLALGADCQGVDCAEAVIARCNRRAPGRFQQATILSLPFADNAFDTIICSFTLECLKEKDISPALQELRRVSASALFLKICVLPEDGSLQRTVKNRHWWENTCLTAGWRLHPREFLSEPYETRNLQTTTCTVILEKIPDASLQLARTVDDCLRESGQKAQARRKRLAAAARNIWRGDCVLLFACGCGEGAHILWRNSSAAQVTGLTENSHAALRAAALYGRESAVSFLPGSMNDISFIADNSMDCLVFPDLDFCGSRLEKQIIELHRVLKPTGRMIASLPQNALQLPQFGRIKKTLEIYGFLLEKMFAQFELLHSWREFPVTEDAPENAEWVVLQTMKSPLEGACVPYATREHAVPHDWQFHDGNFEKLYHNPWLHEGLVCTNLRPQNASALQSLAEKARDISVAGSPDRALSLCVLAYRHLESEEKGTGGDAPARLLGEIEDWLGAASSSPIDQRWTASLSYVAGLMHLRHGNHEKAEKAFNACAAVDALRYTPTLGTKTVGALFHLAVIAISRKEEAKAKNLLQRVLTEVFHLFSSGGIASLGSFDYLLPHNMVEMRQIADIGAQCAAWLGCFDPHGARHRSLAEFTLPIHAPSAYNVSALGVESARAWGKSLAGKKVYFWGCGQMYALRKHLFAACKPQYILYDALPENGVVPSEVDGIPIRHPDEVLPHGEKLPIVVFAWPAHAASITRTLAVKYPNYTEDDIILCTNK